MTKIASKFGGLSASVADTFKMPIISPVTDQPLKDKSGKEAFLELASADSEIGRKIARERQAAMTQRALRGRAIAQDDPTEQNIALIAALTRSWYLVDLDGKQIDVPFSLENATELYSDPGMAWLYRQAFVAANEVANFIKRSSIA
jgi:hypothetical protein